MVHLLSGPACQQPLVSLVSWRPQYGSTLPANHLTGPRPQLHSTVLAPACGLTSDSQDHQLT